MRARAHPVDIERRMNKSEAKYAAEVLEIERRAGLIQCWMYESIKLRLADNTFYTPDFFVVDSEGYCWFVEFKGFWRDDARAKLKIAAEQYPMFKFVAVQANPKRDGGGYKREEFNG